MHIHTCIVNIRQPFQELERVSLHPQPTNNFQSCRQYAIGNPQHRFCHQSGHHSRSGRNFIANFHSFSLYIFSVASKQDRHINWAAQNNTNREIVPSTSLGLHNPPEKYFRRSVSQRVCAMDPTVK